MHGGMFKAILKRLDREFLNDDQAQALLSAVHRNALRKQEEENNARLAQK